MGKIKPTAAGLSLGIIFALLYAGWFLIVAFGFGEPALQWWKTAHFIEVQSSAIQFNFGTAFISVIGTFIVGYILGVLFVFLYNKLQGGKI